MSSSDALARACSRRGQATTCMHSQPLRLRICVNPPSPERQPHRLKATLLVLLVVRELRAADRERRNAPGPSQSEQNRKTSIAFGRPVQCIFPRHPMTRKSEQQSMCDLFASVLFGCVVWSLIFCSIRCGMRFPCERMSLRCPGKHRKRATASNVIVIYRLVSECALCNSRGTVAQFYI